MMMSLLLPLAGSFVLLVLVLIFRLHYTRKGERKGQNTPKDVPHKFFFGIATHMFRSGMNGTVYDWMVKTCESHDWKPWCWSTPFNTQLLITDPEDLKHAFHKNADNYTHGKRKERFQELLGDGIFNSDGAIWKQQRTMASHMFTKAQLDYMETVFVRNAGKVCSLLGTHADEKTVCDIQRFMYCYTFDSINEIAFGRAVDSLGGNEKDLLFQKSFDASQSICTTRFVNPFWKIHRLLNIKTEKELLNHLKIIDDYLHEVIDEKMKDRESNEQNLVAMHITQCEIDGNTYTASDLRDIILNFTIAGRDTTASASTSMILELLRNPDCMDRVLSEIKEANHINDMHYLKAVFQETIRLNPPVSFDSKTTTNEDVLPSGIVIRPGVQLGFHPIAFTRNPKLYPEPLKFKPSRWMNEDGTCKTYDPFVFPQFNMGPRICLGRHMAAIEAMVVVSSILSEFKLKLAPKQTFTRHYSPVPPLRSGLQVEVERLVKE
eukprot:TRINITY_DN1483_c0_g1_i11.p1 TRINITY_DN1483_c0_g1~~TRINITY_DN1483_c0_g1_i11.p1  ORF type:complete len:491 (+),score=112.99 TRINITY_DN1483_c0_g1_i11:95-1567(+)